MKTKTEMEQPEKTLTEQESLLLIGQMIRQAKSSVQENGFIFMLWGWLVLAASISNYLLLYVFKYEHHYLPWPILMTLGAVISMLHGKKQMKQEACVKTHLGTFMKYLWTAFGVSLAYVIIYMAKIGIEAAYPLILLVYGIGTFVTGGALSFRPLIFGGICCWILAVIAAFFDFQVQLLLLSLAIIVAYIIPGHLLKQRAAHEKI